MKWTKEIPIKDGYYWAYSMGASISASLRIVMIYKGDNEDWWIAGCGEDFDEKLSDYIQAASG